MSEAPAPVTEPVVAPLPGGEPSLVGAAAGPSTESGTSSETSTESGGASETAGAPAEDLTVTLPDTLTVDPEAMTAFQEFAKTNKLTKEAAQAAADMFASQVTKQAENFAKAQAAAWASTITEWRAEIEKDPAFMGEAKTTSLQSIARIVDEHGTPGLREALDLTGAGNNPAIVKFLHNIAKVLDEGTPITGVKPPQGAQTPGQILYGEPT